MELQNKQSLKIVHCFRSPMGGIFRHVRDLLDEQVRAGHQVGIICDSSTGGDYEEALFEQITAKLRLGLHRIPMERAIAPRDVSALWKTWRILTKIQPDVVHSHSAKGGVYGRMGAWLSGAGCRKLYCPHGGALHYDPATLKGKIYFLVEGFMEHFTDRLVFVSQYERNAYHDKVGVPRCPERVVLNGLKKEEFKPVSTIRSPADFLYIGMMRDLKGPDVFLDAFRDARNKSGKNLTALFVGDGPDKEKYLAQITRLGLEDCISVHDAMIARDAFSRAKIIVAPSRAESMPYLVLEAVAAQKPMIATRVGGVPEIFLGHDQNLVEPDNPQMLAERMLDVLNDKRRQQKAEKLAASIQDRFSLQTMSAGIEKAYKA